VDFYCCACCNKSIPFIHNHWIPWTLMHMTVTNTICSVLAVIDIPRVILYLSMMKVTVTISIYPVHARARSHSWAWHTMTLIWALECKKTSARRRLPRTWKAPGSPKSHPQSSLQEWRTLQKGMKRVVGCAAS
jgi:hypothetical protein